MRSAWESTGRMCGLSCTAGCRRTWKPTIREAGRAGRDGEPAECILYYSGRDVVTNQLFIERNQDNRELDDYTRQLVLERDRERLKKDDVLLFYE